MGMRVMAARRRLMKKRMTATPMKRKMLTVISGRTWAKSRPDTITYGRFEPAKVGIARSQRGLARMVEMRTSCLSGAIKLSVLNSQRAQSGTLPRGIKGFRPGNVGGKRDRLVDHNYRDQETRKPFVKVLYSFGRADQLDTGTLRRLVGSVSRYLEPSEARAISERLGEEWQDEVRAPRHSLASLLPCHVDVLGILLRAAGVS